MTTKYPQFALLFLLLIALFSVSVFATIPATETLDFWYRFEEPNNTTLVADAYGDSGNGNLVNNSITVSDGINGRCVRFFGDDKITFSGIHTNLNDNFTYNFWYASPNLAGDTVGVLGWDSGSGADYLISGFRTDQTGYMFQGQGQYKNSGYGKNTTGWHMATIVGKYNASISRDNYWIYIDGVQRLSGVSFPASWTSSYYIPALGSWSASRSGNYFTGYIDEFAGWTSALTSADISTLYNSGSAQTLVGQQYPTEFTMSARLQGTSYECGTSGHLPCRPDITIYGVDVDNSSEYYDSYNIVFTYFPTGTVDDHWVNTTANGNDRYASATLTPGNWSLLSVVQILSGSQRGQDFFSTDPEVEFKVGSDVSSVTVTSISTTSALFNSVISVGDTSYASFKYKYGSGDWEYTPEVEVHANDTGLFTQWVTGLVPDRTYNMTALIKVVSDVGNATYISSLDEPYIIFSTSNVTHEVGSTNVSAIGNATATFTSIANSSQTFFTSFKYKKTTDFVYTYGNTQIQSPATNFAFNFTQTGLVANTSYYVAGCITQYDNGINNDLGNLTYCGSVATFTTNATANSNDGSSGTSTDFWDVLGVYNTSIFRVLLGFAIIIGMVLLGAYFFGKWNQQFSSTLAIVFAFIGCVVATVVGLLPMAILILILVGCVIIVILKQMLFSGQGQGG